MPFCIVYLYVYIVFVVSKYLINIYYLKIMIVVYVCKWWLHNKTVLL